MSKRTLARDQRRSVHILSPFQIFGDQRMKLMTTNTTAVVNVRRAPGRIRPRFSGGVIHQRWKHSKDAARNIEAGMRDSQCMTATAFCWDCARGRPGCRAGGRKQSSCQGTGCVPCRKKSGDSRLSGPWAYQVHVRRGTVVLCDLDLTATISSADRVSPPVWVHQTAYNRRHPRRREQSARWPHPSRLGSP